MESKTEVCMQTLSKFKLKDDEYIKDGIIYCSKCNTKRMCQIIENNEVVMQVRIMCDCQRKKAKEEREMLLREEQYFKFQRLLEASLLGRRYTNVTFDNTDLNVDASFVNAYERCRRYCENVTECLDKGYGIYLLGNCGCGKTHLMACMVNELSKKLVASLITNFFEIKQNVDNKEFIKLLINIPFLFIDDIGSERVFINNQDTFMQEVIYNILNKRYNSKKPTVFSSNLTPQELVEQRGFWQKTVDRIVEMSSAILKIKSKSFRTSGRDKKLPF